MERARTKDNNKLGEFTLTDIPPMPRGKPEIEVSFDIDANGILNVTALEKSTGKSNKVEITNDKSRLSREDVERMKEEAETYAQEDEIFRETVEAKNSLEGYCLSMQNALDDVKSKISEDDTNKVKNIITDTLKWLENNQKADKEEYVNKRKEVETMCKPMMEEMSKNMGMSKEIPEKVDQTYSGPNIEEVD